MLTTICRHRAPAPRSGAATPALRRANKSVHYVELEGDDHWLSSASTRTQMLQEIETFLAQHLKKSAAPASASDASPATIQ